MTSVERQGSLAVILLLALSAFAPAVAALESSVAATRTTGTFSVASAFPTLDGTGVVVAVLDTGVDNGHETFRGAFATGIDVSLPPTSATPAPKDAPCADPDDTHGHGTHVAAIALGRGDANGTHRGVAPGAKLVDVKVALDFTPLSVMEGLERGLQWVLDYNAGVTVCRSDAAPRIHVVSVSFGGASPGDPNDKASRLVDNLTAAGVVVVVAAGNCGPGEEQPSLQCESTGADSVSSPAVAKGAIAVAAVDHRGTPERADDVIADYSSRGPNGAEPKPNVAAPGSSVSSARFSLVPGQAPDGWTESSGTSMAAPHVSGIAALLLDAVPTLKPADVKSLLQATAEDLGPAGWDPAWGHGYVDARAAVGKALARANNQAPLVAFGYGCRWLTCELDASPSRDPDGGPLTFVWEFGDGKVAEGARATHTYAAEGEWFVRLTATDAEGVSGASLSRVFVFAEPPAPASRASRAAPPEAVANVEPREGPPGTRFFFDAAGSDAPGGRIVSYAWDSDGDGVPDGEAPTFVWTAPSEGVHVVRLSVMDAEGRFDVASVTVLVDSAKAASAPATTSAGDPFPPTVDILTPQQGAVVASPFVVRWLAQDNAGIPKATVFVDGVKVTETTAGHATITAAPGDHVLVVRVTDAAGNTAEAGAAFSVLGAPEPAPEPMRTIRAAPPKGGGSATAASAETKDVPAPALALALAPLAIAALARRRAR